MSVMSHASPQFHQLQMFATPQEIGQMVSSNGGGRVANAIPRTVSEHAKAERMYGPGQEYRFGHTSPESYLKSLKADIDTAGGIVEPMHVWHGTSRRTPVLMDGHHRAIIGMATNRLMPVVHHEGRSIADAAEDAFYGSHSAKGW